ncbi:MAG: hypothetical protein H7144_13025 [Burkholderiales bacterium]|nr:hypothetical protein [Phycisphaerae bacterium]
MASRRKGPALFEVIRASQQKQLEQQRKLEEAKNHAPGVLQNAASLLGSPHFWLAKGKKAFTGGSSVVTRPVVAQATASRPVRYNDAPAEARPSPIVAAPREAVMRQIPAAPVPDIDRQTPIVAAPSITEPPVTEPAPQRTPVYRQAIAPAIPATVPHHDPEPAHESPAAAAARMVRQEIAATSDIEDSVFVEQGYVAHKSQPRIEPSRIETKSDRTIDSVVDMFGGDHAEPRDSIWSKLNLKLNYTTGVVAGCLLLGAVAVALIVSRDKPDDKLALADQNIRPNVLDVKPSTRQPVTPVVPPAAKPPADTGLARPDLTRQPGAVRSEIIADKPIKVPTNVKRENGKQYLVLLSFPRDVDANELVKFLADNGVAATAEKGLPGYSKSWYSVVTVRGFAKTQGIPEYDTYSARIAKLMEKYARGSKFKTFKPDLYSWRAAN